MPSQKEMRRERLNEVFVSSYRTEETGGYSVKKEKKKSHPLEREADDQLGSPS